MLADSQRSVPQEGQVKELCSPQQPALASTFIRKAFLCSIPLRDALHLQGVPHQSDLQSSQVEISA